MTTPIPDVAAIKQDLIGFLDGHHPMRLTAHEALAIIRRLEAAERRVKELEAFAEASASNKPTPPAAKGGGAS